MAKYFLNFETIAEYNSSYDSLIKPNVSLIEENNIVKFKPSNSIDGHEYVQIGGIKWATMNIGAETETDYGLYFQWGDTQGYPASQVGANSVAYAKPFYYEDYKFNNGTSTWGETGMTKYNSSDGKTTLETCDDAATANWGGDWRMPTIEEYEELTANTTSTWVNNYNDSGINGRLFTSISNSNIKLFFPAVGYCSNATFSDAGSVGNYWSSILSTANKASGRGLRFNSSNVNTNSIGGRYDGRSIRPVHS